MQTLSLIILSSSPTDFINSIALPRGSARASTRANFWKIPTTILYIALAFLGKRTYQTRKELLYSSRKFLRLTRSKKQTSSSVL